MPLCCRKDSKNLCIAAWASPVDTPVKRAIRLDSTVTSSRPSRPIILAAASSPMERRRIAALSRLFSSACCASIVLYPCFDDFGYPVGFLVRQQAEVFQLHFKL